MLICTFCVFASQFTSFLFALSLLSNALISQPSIRSFNGGGGTSYSELSFEQSIDIESITTVCTIETQAPLVKIEIYKIVYQDGIMKTEDYILKDSAWGIDFFWCNRAALAIEQAGSRVLTPFSVFPSSFFLPSSSRLLSCVVITPTPIVHSNTGTMSLLKTQNGQFDPRHNGHEE